MVDLAQRMSWLRGPAAARGHRWAVDLRASGYRGRWPSWEASARVRELARARVADLANGDAELLELLALVCAEAAGREWGSPAPRAGAVAF